MSPDRIRPGSAAGGPPERPVANGAPADPSPPEDELDFGDGFATTDAPGATTGNGTADLTAVPVAPSPEATETDDDVDTLHAPPVPVGNGVFRRLYFGGTAFDFVRRKRIWFLLSSLVILAGVGSLATRGLNLGIDFVGGTSWTVQSKSLTITQAQNAVAKDGLLGATMTVLGTNSTNSRTVEVEAKLPKGQSAGAAQSQANKVAATLAAAAHQPADSVSIEQVGPSWGSQITQKAIVALIVFFILIALYISLFFEWRMAVAAIVAVAHDILVTVGVYSLTGFEVTPDTVVAILTILGYSLYDTIVVFDRVRDNVRHLSIRDRMTYSDVVNLSMNQTLARSVNTSLVAIMPILAVLVLGADLLGATTLQYFGLALLVGLTTGAYSSIFIASPLVAVMKEREPRYRQIRERLLARGVDRVLLSPAMVAGGLLGDDVLAPRRAAPAPRRAVNRPGSAARPGPNGTGEPTADGEARERPAPARAPRPGADRPQSRRPASRGRRRGGRR